MVAALEAGELDLTLSGEAATAQFKALEARVFNALLERRAWLAA